MEELQNFGQRAADKVTGVVGSWSFILTQSVLLCMWVVLNSIKLITHWDPPPFILLNLMLSFQAAYTAPIIMMSQNRQAAIDREEARTDFLTNQSAERGIRIILTRMDAQDREIAFLRKVVESQIKVIESQTMVIAEELEASQARVP